MDNLIIKATKTSPEINFDFENNLLLIKGESYPENTSKFFSSVFSWLKEYLANFESNEVTVNIELYYFNSSSSKVLFDIFDLLEEKATSGKNITINWFHEEEDEDSIEYGEEFQEDLEAVKFNLVPKQINI